MLKNYRFVVFASSSFALAASVLLACSSDDTVVVVPETDGGDSGPGSKNDAAPDASDAGRGDADATADADTDAGSDAGADADPIVTDAGITFQSYPGQVAQAMCGALARCCFGDQNLEAGAPVDGGTYDRAQCESDFTQFGGFEQAVVTVGDGGVPESNVNLDQNAAYYCVQKLAALSCSLSGTEFQAVRAYCFEAVTGKLTAGQSCTDSIECQVGNFCNTQTGKCEALRAIDGPCGDWTNDPALAQNACSYRYSGDPKHYCEFYDYNTDQALPEASWKCKDARPNGEGCINNTWCASGLCNPDTYICESPSEVFPPATCSGYVH